MTERRMFTEETECQGLHSGNVVFARKSGTSVTRAGRAGDKTRKVDRNHPTECLGSRPDSKPACSSVATLTLRQ